MWREDAIGNKMRIAALITCHNRKAKTLACLNSLFRLASEVDVYLTDDGCTDGTTEEVLLKFQQVHIVTGSGNLYWNRGMHAAWSEALKIGYDQYLWLNDDIELYSGFLEEMQECCQGNASIVCGLVETMDHSDIIYGGCDGQKQLIRPNGQSQNIVWMNGNVVLVPRAIVEKIGILDPYFIHDLGDVDYGMRALMAGFKVLSTRVPVAAGYRNDVCRVRKWNTNLVDRFRQLSRPLGSPLSRNFHFRYRHFGLLHALAYNSRIILLNLLTDSMVKKIWGETYLPK